MTVKNYNNKNKKITENLDIDIGLLGHAIINQMSKNEKNKFHYDFNEVQKYNGKILLNEKEFAYSLRRRGKKLEVLIRKNNDISFYEDIDGITMLIIRKIPEILTADLKGKYLSDLCGDISSLPLLSQIKIIFVEKTEAYLTVMGKAKWSPYQPK